MTPQPIAYVNLIAPNMRATKMAERIAFELNGETRTVEVAPDTPLL